MSLLYGAIYCNILQSFIIKDMFSQRFLPYPILKSTKLPPLKSPKAFHYLRRVYRDNTERSYYVDNLFCGISQALRPNEVYLAYFLILSNRYYDFYLFFPYLFTWSFFFTLLRHSITNYYYNMYCKLL